jgi:predicted nucleic acid-binding protein
MAHLSELEVAEWVDSLAFAAELVDPDIESLKQASDAGLRDAADEPVLALMLASGADLLVTGDKDLLALAQHHPILTPAAFCARHAP